MDPMVVGLLMLLIRDIAFPILGIVGGVVILARTNVGRRLMASIGGRGPADDQISQLREHVLRLEAELDETQERIDVTERMLAESRQQLPSRTNPERIVTPV